MQSHKSVINQKVDLAVVTADSALITGLFSMFQNAELRSFLEETGHYALFPLAASLSLFRAILAWRQAKLDAWQKGPVTKAIVETISAAAITTAVVGGFVATSIFATVSPIIFTAALGAKALFHAVSAAYYGYKAFSVADPEKKKNYRSAMLANSVATLSLTLATVAVALVMIAAKPALAFLGIIGGGIATLYSAYKAFSRPASRTQEAALRNEAADEDDDNDMESSSSSVYHRLNINPQVRVAVVNAQRPREILPARNGLSNFPGTMFNHKQSQKVHAVKKQKLIAEDLRSRRHV